MSRLDAKSISQRNAEAVAAREATYGEEHAASMSRRMDRSRVPVLRQLIRDLQRAERLEAPVRLHAHAVDDGGTPAYAGEFASRLYGSAYAVDRGDPQSPQPLLTPYRATMEGWRKSGREEDVRIVVRCVQGVPPAHAAWLEGVPAWCAKRVAASALRAFWADMTSTRIVKRRVDE